MLRRSACVVALLAAATAPLWAQRPAEPPAPARPQTSTASPAAQPEEGRGGPPPTREVATVTEEKLSQTSHTLRIGGREIRYTATAGTLPIRLDNGRIAARMFFVAYTQDGQDAASRPISFLYNGGPGSPSMYLHLGSFGPRRVRMGDDGTQPAPPYRIVDNENSLLDTTDLVFIDAIDTGYSRVVAGTDATQFHSQSGDIRSFGEFIAAYLSKYDRWGSPKFLIGESYGTIRSAGLAQELQTRHGIELNGIALISSLLTYQTISTSPQNDVAYVSYFPTYTTTAWYHKRLPPDLQNKSLKQVADEARAFATGEYATTLLKGNSLT